MQYKRLTNNGLVVYRSGKRARPLNRNQNQ
jgi:hypothetical protein